MSPRHGDLVERVRSALSSDNDLREVTMFGGRSFMVDEQLLVSALRSGDLLVRVDPDRHEELTSLPGAAQATMGAGRTMGRGWISVDAAAVATAERLSAWIALARARRDPAVET